MLPFLGNGHIIKVQEVHSSQPFQTVNGGSIHADMFLYDLSKLVLKAP